MILYPEKGVGELRHSSGGRRNVRGFVCNQAPGLQGSAILIDRAINYITRAPEKLRSVMRSVPPRGSGWVRPTRSRSLSLVGPTNSSGSQIAISTRTHPLPRGGTDFMTPGANKISELPMNQRVSWRPYVQLVVVLLCAVAVKQYYSTASVNQLRWILAPTTALVELVTGSTFEFESYAGYISSDRSVVIAASCAGVNFLITAFLMLSLRKLWAARSQNRSDRLGWRFIPIAGVAAYIATLVANTVRIATAVRFKGLTLGMSWLSGNQLHRLEGIFIYFGFLLVLFMVSEKMNSEVTSISRPASSSRNASSLLRLSVFPLLIYYATALGIPLVNGVYRSGRTADFWQHSVFVLLTPLLFILPLAALREFFCETSCDFVDRIPRSTKSTIHKITQNKTRNEIT